MRLYDLVGDISLIMVDIKEWNGTMVLLVVKRIHLSRNLHRISADYFGYYRMYDNKIYHVYADGPQQAYTFNLEKPLLPSDMVMDHARGKVGLDEYVYFLSYFEDTAHLLLTYELDRNKYWSVDKNNDDAISYKFSYRNDCGDCNNINTIALTEEGVIAVVSGETFLRILD